MKYLLVVIVVMVAFWIWRQNRHRAEEDTPQAPSSPATVTPQVMVACRLCGAHVPQTDAVAGREGAYCSSEHLVEAERQQMR